MRLTTAILLSALVVASLSGCSSNPVTASARTQGQALAEQQKSAITHRGTLSVHTQLVYRLLDLEAQAQEDPAAALAALDADESKTITEVQRGLAVAETCYLLADGAPSEDDARRLFARAVVFAGTTLRAHASLESLLDARHRLLGELYSRGLARFIVLSQAVEGHPKDWRGVGGENPVSVTVQTGPGLVDPALFDRVIPTDEVQLEGIPNRHVRHGLGVPLIAIRDNREGNGRKDPLRGSTIAEPLTVVARLSDDGGIALAFVDPRRTKTIPAKDGRVLSVAADFTSPLAWLVANSPLYTQENPSLFDPESFAHMTGMYFAEPYDPQKIPVIMTHGLWSSPLTWIWLANEVWGDKELRDRYQVWYYAYPTGLPILANAATFRKQIETVRKSIDPEGDDPATRGYVLIGHSMGGLLSKHMVKSVGNRIWNARSTLPFDRVKASAKDREFMRSAFFHEPLPFVERVIFMATPHRGSGLAEGLVGAIGNALISLPEDLESATERIIADNPGILRKGGALEEGPMTSIRGLRSDSPLLAAVDDAPWKRGLPFHSIIGDEKEAGRTGGSDGVVPYESSHLDGAQSELVVHSGHSVTNDPAAMAEVRRILRLHLKERGK